jgi:hypothetical protein
MELRTFSRITGAVGSACLVVALIVTLAAPGSAVEQPRVVAVKDQKVVKDYGPLIGMNQGAMLSPDLTINYESCSVDTSCDVIPLTVPDPGDDEDFFLTITLEWETEEVKQVPVFGDTAVNDLDLWVTNDPLVPTAGPDGDGFTYHSAGLEEPERVTMFAPVGDFHVFVVNASGINTGYRLTFDYNTDLIPDVFESLPPAFTPSASRPQSAATPAAPVLPRAPQPAPLSDDVPAAAPAPVKPNLAIEGGSRPDTSFSTFTPTALEDEVAAPEVQAFVPAALERAAPPSTAALILWMVAIPLLLLAAGAFLLSRRQANLIRI